MLNDDELTMVSARNVAVRAHRGQKDKAGFDYYLAHVADVAARVGDDPVLRAVAYLHDVVEDTAWTLAELADLFPAPVVAAVDALTRRWGEQAEDYYARVRANPIALTVKRADIASNTDPDRMALLPKLTRLKLERKYAHALEVLDSDGAARTV